MLNFTKLIERKEEYSHEERTTNKEKYELEPINKRKDHKLIKKAK